MARERGSRRGRDSEDSGSKKKFQYKRRGVEAAKKRATQGASNFDSPFVDGFNDFKPASGDNIVRIMPPTWEDAPHCGLDIFLHYNIGSNGSSYLCPKEMLGKDCPICEERDKALADGDEDYAKKLRAGKRVLHWLIDRSAEKDGPKYWPMPWTIDRDISLLSVDKSNGAMLSYDDPEEGYDIEFSKEGKGLGTKYVGIQIARRESDLGKNAEEWLDYITENPLPEILNYYDYDHLAKALSGGIKEWDNDKDSKKESRKPKRSSDDDDEPKGRSSRRRNKKKPSHTWESVHEMGPDELDDLVDENGLDLDPDDFDDDEEYADEICHMLKISEPSDKEDEPDEEDEEEPEEDEDEGTSGKMKRRMRRSRR